MLQVVGLDVLGLTLADWMLASELRAAAPSQPPAIEALNRFPRMVQQYFVRRVRQAEQVGMQRMAALKTKADAENYVREVRDKIRQSFGPFPEKTPLKPRVTGVVERDEYKIENVIFESRPGFLVTGNLYIPKGRKFPLPGVVGTCGHSSNGKAETAYQSFSQGLARMGYVVLIYDPIGQGERLQYPDEKLKSRIGVGVREHLYAGNQQFLVGEFIGSWRAWDGIRALDYLLTREEVDPNPGRRYRQLGRRNHDHLALRRGTALDHGRAFLFRYHVSPQHGKRVGPPTPSNVRPRPWRWASTTPTSWPPRPPIR